MPKHAVNTSEQTRIRKLFLAGNPPEAIAAHMNVELSVVKAWHPDNVKETKEAIRKAEAVEEGKQAEVEAEEAEAEAKRQARSLAGKKAAATRDANRKTKKDAAKLKDKELAEARDRAQEETSRIQQEAGTVQE